MFVNIAKYCESIQDVIRSLIEMTTKPNQPNPTPLIIILLQNIAKLFKTLFDLWQKWWPNQPNPSYHYFTAKYCETIQVIWSLTEMIAKSTQPLSSFCCKILRTYSSHCLAPLFDLGQTWFSNLPNPLSSLCRIWLSLWWCT